MDTLRINALYPLPPPLLGPRVQRTGEQQREQPEREFKETFGDTMEEAPSLPAPEDSPRPRVGNPPPAATDEPDPSARRLLDVRA
jgi:hypothetical protein